MVWLGKLPFADTIAVLALSKNEETRSYLDAYW